VVHAINFYERLGAQAVFFEDQESPKRCGHIAGKRRLLHPEQMEANIRAAAENRINSDTFIIARTDAREVGRSASPRRAVRPPLEVSVSSDRALVPV
jgi:2,3-dimethylmalate lyase